MWSIDDLKEMSNTCPQLAILSSFLTPFTKLPNVLFYVPPSYFELLLALELCPLATPPLVMADAIDKSPSLDVTA